MGQFKLKRVRKWLRNAHKQAAGLSIKKKKKRKKIKNKSNVKRKL